MGPCHCSKQFKAEPLPQHLSLFTIGADVYLGGTGANRPLCIANAPPDLRVDNPTTTWMYSAIAAGNASFRGTIDIKSIAYFNPPNGRSIIDVPQACVLTIDGSNTPTLTGLAGGTFGRVISLVVRRGTLILIHNDVATPAEQRMVLPGYDNIVIRENGSALFWYDPADERWRLLGVVP